MLPTIIFDGDNTLWECGKYYDEIIDAFVVYTAARTRMERDKIKSLLDSIDVVAAGFPGGFNRDRFPRALRATSLAVDCFMGLQPDQAAGAHAEMLGQSVFRAPYELYDQVYDVLAAYRRKWEIVVVTKGDPGVQRDKILKHNLDNCVDFWTVLGHKDVASWQVALEKLARVRFAHDPARTWVVGDSLRDDIKPALELGLGAIHVANGSGNWGWESAHDQQPHYRIQNITELLSVLPISPDDPMAYVAARKELSRTGA